MLPRRRRAADAHHEHDPERSQFAESVRRGRRVERPQLLHIDRSVARFGQRHYDAGKFAGAVSLEWFKNKAMFDLLDELHQTVSAHEVGSDDVQGVPALSRSVAACLPEAEGETGGSRSGRAIRSR